MNVLTSQQKKNLKKKGLAFHVNTQKILHRVLGLCMFSCYVSGFGI